MIVHAVVKLAGMENGTEQIADASRMENKEKSNFCDRNMPTLIWADRGTAGHEVMEGHMQLSGDRISARIFGTNTTFSAYRYFSKYNFWGVYNEDELLVEYARIS